MPTGKADCLTPTFFAKESKNGLTFDIQVIPHAARAVIVGWQEGVLKIKVTAQPQEGAANEACIRLLAKELGLRKSQLAIFAGQKSRRKTIRVEDISRMDLEKKLQDVTE